MIMAIDQGATKTMVALVSEGGEILATGGAEGACYFVVGLDKAFAQIDAALQVARASAPGGQISRVYGGISGANWPEEIEMLTGEMRLRYGLERVTVCNDCVVALRGGTRKAHSMVLCAGSGLNGAVMVGGALRQVLNNYVLPEDQGGDGIGRRALDAVFQSEAGIRPPTRLTRTLLEYFSCETVDELLVARDHDALKRPPRTAVALILEAAEQNDPVALEVLYEFSSSVAQYATGSLRKYGLVGLDCDIVLSGGVFKADNPLFVETISAQVHRVSRQANVLNAKYEPIVGACMLALDEAGADERILARCRKSARALGLTRKKYGSGEPL